MQPAPVVHPNGPCVEFLDRPSRPALSRRLSDRRLLRIANMLDRLPPRRFDFCRFVGADWEGRWDLSCGTTACGIGHATTMPYFRRLGLRLSDVIGYMVLPRVFSVENAVVNLLGLTHNEYEFLFLPDYRLPVVGLGPRATAKELAAHLRKFVAWRSGEGFGRRAA